MKELQFKNKKVLARVDFNVPLDENHNITDHTRIDRAIPTLKKILSEGGLLSVCTHMGRPKVGEDNYQFSTQHLVNDFAERLGTKVQYVSDCIGEEVMEAVKNQDLGTVILLENTRFYNEEKKGDKEFAKALAKPFDIYVNDAFGTAHREHASTATIAQFFEGDHKTFGYLMNAEVKNGNKVLHHPVSPVTAIVGGAKVSDKIKLLENLIDSNDNILIGGGMAYTFIKASGGKIGNSLCEDEYLDLAREILVKAKKNNTAIYLPVDSKVADDFKPDANTAIVPSDEIEDGWMGLDIGPKAIEQYKEVIMKSKTILWNGPMGVFEFEAFSSGTFSVAQSVADSTQEGAFSLIGGGDSVSAINKSGLSDKVSYVSTGGGAMLEFLEGKELPGIKAMTE